MCRRERWIGWRHIRELNILRPVMDGICGSRQRAVSYENEWMMMSSIGIGRGGPFGGGRPITHLL